MFMILYWPALAGPRCPFVSSSSYLPIIYQNIQISSYPAIQESNTKLLYYLVGDVLSYVHICKVVRYNKTFKKWIVT